MPLLELKGFRKPEIRKGEEALAEFRIALDDLRKWDPVRRQRRLYPDEYRVCIGKNARDIVMEKRITLQ